MSLQIEWDDEHLDVTVDSRSERQRYVQGVHLLNGKGIRSDGIDLRCTCEDSFHHQQLKSLDPEKLQDRLTALDEYAKEINCIIEDDEEEDLDEYMKEIEAMTDEEIPGGSLPSVLTYPVTSPSVSISPATSKVAKIAEVELNV